MSTLYAIVNDLGSVQVIAALSIALNVWLAVTISEQSRQINRALHNLRKLSRRNKILSIRLAKYPPGVHPPINPPAPGREMSPEMADMVSEHIALTTDSARTKPYGDDL